MESNNSRFLGEYSWDTVCLKEISLKIGSGSTPRGGESAYIPERKKFAFIRSQNVYDFKFDVSGLRFISDEDANKLKGVHLQKDDVLINITGDGVTFSRCCLVPEEILPAAVNQHVAIIRLDKSKCLPGYLMAYLCLPETKAYIESFNAGGSRRAITKGHIESFEISLPPMLIQEHISRVTLGLLAKQSINTQINQTLEQMAQALFKSWFVDFDPVVDNALDAGFFEQDLEFSDELLRRAEARKAARENADFKPLSEDIRQLFPAAFEEGVEPSVGINGWIPKGWFIAPLDNIANFQNGLALQKFRPDSDEDEYLPVLKIAQLRQGYCDNNERARIDLKESCRVYNGDMIFSWSGTLMTDIWTGGNAALNQHLYKVTSSKYPLSFYFHWTNHHLVRFQHIAAAKAVTMGHIKKGDLSDSFCVVPKNQTLAYFDSIAGAYLEQAKNVRLQCNTLVKLRDCLLPKLISGELCLEELEAKLTSESVV
ncbi:type I restriction enzyme S subunit [Pantoea alhagi]|uniref:restriction endonuclease subunit S n=1 Tax=Mixta sp. BE291 TaxID=3158787 RepID=UPI002859DEAC|nr:type I restriction enzyme S subunit [Pantoea alhagi]